MKIRSKYAILCGLLFAGVLGFVACNDKDENAISVENRHSKCLSHEDSVSSEGIFSPDSIAVSCSNGVIYIEHYNLKVNCGFQTVNVSISTNEDTIRVTEFGIPESADCLCEINNFAQIENIPSGRYVLIIENCNPEPYKHIVNL